MLKSFSEYLEETFQVPVKINAPGHPNHGKSGIVSGISSESSIKVKLPDGSHSWHKKEELQKG